MSKTSDPQVRLKGNLYARPDYFTTDVARGATRTPAGGRVCTLTNDFLLGFRDALVYECGKSFRAVLKACGRRWGQTFVARFEKEIAAAYQTPAKDLPAGVVHACLADAFSYHGWGKLSVDLSAADRGVVVVEVENAVLPSLIRESDRPVDHLTAGLLAAVVGHFAGARLDAVQTDCPSCGGAAARFVVSAPERVAEVERWLDDAPADAPPGHDEIVRRFTAPPAATGRDARPPADANGVPGPTGVA